VTANAWPKAVHFRPRHDNTKTDLVQEGEIKLRRATYGDGILIRLAPIGAAPAREIRSPISRERLVWLSE
jgi:hypothetical protein